MGKAQAIYHTGESNISRTAVQDLKSKHQLWSTKAVQKWRGKKAERDFWLYEVPLFIVSH